MPSTHMTSQTKPKEVKSDVLSSAQKDSSGAGTKISSGAGPKISSGAAGISGARSTAATPLKPTLRIKQRISPWRKFRTFLRERQQTLTVIIVSSIILLGAILAMRGPVQQAVSAMFVNDDSLIRRINENKFVYGFTAAAAPEFDGRLVRDIEETLGRVLWGPNITSIATCMSGWQEPAAEEDLPKEYDTRKQFPKCFYPSHTPGDNCSASYATAAADALSARFCMHDSDTYEGLRLSAQDLISCNPNDKGCNSGTLEGPLEYVRTMGTVSDFCFPYEGRPLSCTSRCPGEKVTRILSYCRTASAEAMKKEIKHKGPLSAVMLLSDELLVYESGVFKPSPKARPLMSRMLDTEVNMPLTHAVSVVGWGTDDNLGKYWIVQNNFGRDWGEGGFARISEDANVLLSTLGVAAILDEKEASQPVPVVEGGIPDIDVTD